MNDVFDDKPQLVDLGPFDAFRPQPGRPQTPYTAVWDQAETDVLTAYLFHMAALGRQVVRHRITTSPATASTDLFDTTTGDVILALHPTGHTQLVGALGILTDCYRRFPHGRPALLLTAPPTEAAARFLHQQRLVGLWPSEGTFHRQEPSAATG